MMKCPKCDINLLEHVDVCPFCKTPLKEGADGKLYEDTQRSSAEKFNQDTGRYSAIDPSKDSYDFDLQYTLTFRDAGEIRQAIADMELGLGQTKPEEQLDTEPVPSAEPHRFKHDHSIEEMEEAARRAEMRRAKRQGKVSKDTGKRQKIERLSRTEREKAVALKAARASKKDKHLGERSHKGLLMGVGVVVIVVALIVGR